MRIGPSLALACMLASGCGADATQLVVLVDSDLVAPAELTEARITIRLEEGGAVEAEQTFALIGANQAQGPGQAQLPFSFGVAPAEQGFDQKIIIEVDGLGPQISISRRAITRFIEGERLLLPMYLARSCDDVDCGSIDQTCTEVGCDDVEIDPARLQSIAPGEEATGIDPGADAGPGDSGVVLDPDAGATDAADPDTGVVDPSDAGMTDADLDAGLADAALEDAGLEDAGFADAGLPDIGLDAGLPDLGTDAGLPGLDGGLDAGAPPDLGGLDSGSDAGDADVDDASDADVGDADVGDTDVGDADDGGPGGLDAASGPDLGASD